MKPIKTKNGDYKLLFKKYVVQEYLLGTSVADLQMQYEIKYQSTIARWIKKYSFQVQQNLGRLETQIETNPLTSELQQLEERIIALEKAIYCKKRLATQSCEHESTDIDTFVN